MIATTEISTSKPPFVDVERLDTMGDIVRNAVKHLAVFLYTAGEQQPQHSGLRELGKLQIRCRKDNDQVMVHAVLHKGNRTLKKLLADKRRDDVFHFLHGRK